MRQRGVTLPAAWSLLAGGINPSIWLVVKPCYKWNTSVYRVYRELYRCQWEWQITPLPKFLILVELEPCLYQTKSVRSWGEGSVLPLLGPGCRKIGGGGAGAQLCTAWGTAKSFSGHFTSGVHLKIRWTLCLFLRTRAWMVGVLRDGALQENLLVDLLQ